MRSRPQTGIDAESLQADVMRFMAIIAFCLIAILALVRNIDAPPVPQTLPPAKAPAAIERPALEKLTAPVPKMTTEPLETVVETTLEPLLPPQPMLLEPIAPAPAPEPLQTLGAELAVAPAHAALEPVILPEPEPDQELAGTTEPAAAEEPGLSLRFVSDRDFLRLLSKRDIQVFLFNEHRAYQLSTSYEFVDAEPPRKLYEVMPMTIPDAISGAANRALGDYSGYRWGLYIPGTIEAQITEHLAAVQSGELVIDRFGRVRHVPAS